MGGRWKNENYERRIAEGLAVAIQQRMAEVNMTIPELSTKIPKAYDTTRKIYKGETFPGPKTLARICEILDFDLDEMERIKKDDQLANKGAIDMDYVERDPIILKLSKLFKVIGEEDKQILLRFAREMAKEAMRIPASDSKQNYPPVLPKPAEPRRV